MAQPSIARMHLTALSSDEGLLLFSVTDQSIGQVLTSDSLAPEVASGLIGATALVLVVP